MAKHTSQSAPFLPNSVVRSATDENKIYLVQKDGRTLVRKGTSIKLVDPPSKNFRLVARSWAAVL
jgi:hypothetical protein